MTDHDASTSEPAERDRAEVLEQKLATPVIVAAVAAVPATFLTMLEGAAENVGHVINFLSLAVLTGETAVLFAMSGNRIKWLRDHWWIVAVVLVTVPAVIFALGPVQLLRLVRFVGALRIIRVNRILKAGRILRRRANLTGPIQATVGVAITLACAIFVALVLSDPTSPARRAVDEAIGLGRVAAVLVAGLILGGATFIVWRYRSNGKAAAGPRELVSKLRSVTRSGD